MWRERSLRSRERAWIVGFAVVTVLVMCVFGCDLLQIRGQRWEPAAAPGEVRWSGELTSKGRGDGAFDAPGFNALIDSAAPSWARSPDAATAELLQLTRPPDGRRDVFLLRTTEKGRPVRTVTISGYGDDSVGDSRYRVAFTRGADGLYRFTSGTRSWRCQSGRGRWWLGTTPCS